MKKNLLFFIGGVLVGFGAALYAVYPLRIITNPNLCPVQKLPPVQEVVYKSCLTQIWDSSLFVINHKNCKITGANADLFNSCLIFNFGTGKCELLNKDFFYNDNGTI